MAGGLVQEQSAKGVLLDSDLLVEQGLGADERWVGDPSEVISNLRSALARETAKVSDALILGLQDLISTEIEKWFGETPKALNKSLLKKIANSVASPGQSGVERTIDALDSIPSWNATKENLNPTQAADLLRDIAYDFRKAKTFLSYQAKCVNAFIYFWEETEDSLNEQEKTILNKKIKDLESFQAWAKVLGDSWVRLGGTALVQNNKMYQSYWNRFIELMCQNREDSYSLELIKTIQLEYLEPKHAELFLRNLGNATLQNRNTVAFKAPIQSSMKVNHGVISIVSTLNMSEPLLNNLKENLAFVCSQEAMLQDRNLEISTEISGNASSLTVTFNSPKELTTFRKTVDLVNKLIKTTYQELS